VIYDFCFVLYWCTNKMLIIISSHLDCCNSLLIGVSDVVLKKLQSVQNAAARLITNTRNFDHITPVLRRSLPTICVKNCHAGLHVSAGSSTFVFEWVLSTGLNSSGQSATANWHHRHSSPPMNKDVYWWPKFHGRRSSFIKQFTCWAVNTLTVYSVFCQAFEDLSLQQLLTAACSAFVVTSFLICFCV